MRSKVVFSSGAAALLSVALVAGCGDDGNNASPDASSPDARNPDARNPDAAAPDAGPAEYTKQTVTLPTGIEMKYVEVGSNAANAETVIFLHGYTDSSRSFFPTIEALTALNANLHIYALDLRGHGESSMPPAADCADDPKTCFELADFSADLDAFMTAENITSAHLVGHSMGTLIAHDFALANKDKVESMVLIGATANSVDNPILKGFILEATIQGDGASVAGLWKPALEANATFGDWPTDAYALTPLDADPDAEDWMAANWVGDATADPAFLAKIVPETARIKLGAWLGAVEMLISSNNSARLADLEVNSLIIWASQDILFPDADQVGLRAALDEAVDACKSGYIWKKYGKVAPPAVGQTDLGHNTQWGAPAAVAADVNAFITTGAPTTNLYFADPTNLTEILSEAAGPADIITKPAATGCP
jgi:non-heme chloroperoxidase